MMGRVWAAIVVVLALLCGAAPRAEAARRPPPDVIRVGGPSDTVDAKIAIVGSSTRLAGKRFKLIDTSTGTTVFTGKLHRAVGRPAPWRFAATADFSSWTTAGNYRVRVGRLRSPVWEIYDGAAGDLLDALLGFFPIAADGNETSTVHGATHLNDADLVTNDPNSGLNGNHFDLTGGWMDAGDPDKWVSQVGFATWALEVAKRFVPSDTNINDNAEVGVRWLMKMHPQAGLFIGQVGDAAYERSLPPFRDPDGDDTSADPRIATRTAYETARSDVAGKAAAALALASETTDTANRLQAAKDWYAMGQASHSAASDPSCSPGDICSYDDSVWEDDMALAAAELYRETGTTQYQTDALHYLADESVDFGAGPDPVQTDPFAAAEICGKLGAAAEGTADEVQPACDALDADAGLAVERANNVFAIASEFGISTTTRSTSEGIIALADGKRTLAAEQRDYILGRNPWGLSFVVGFSQPATQHPYHWLNDADANPMRINGSEPTGWLVPGPTSRARAAAYDPYSAPAHGRFDTRQLGYADQHLAYVYNEGSVVCQATAALLAAMLAS